MAIKSWMSASALIVLFATMILVYPSIMTRWRNWLNERKTDP